MELTVPTRMKVVCPKCKANLKLATERMVAAVAKFKCPGCSSILSVRKPDTAKHGKQPGVGDHQQAGAELQKRARTFEHEMGFEMAEKTADVVDEVKTPEPAEDVKEAAAASEPEKTAKDSEKACDGRKYKRVKFKKKVLVNNQIMVEALDICENGLFLHTGRSFDDGAVVEVGIPTMPGSFDLKVQARVQHNHRGIGMGMQFIDLDDMQKAKLNKLINSLDEAAKKELENRKKILLVGGSDTARNINKSKLVLDGFYVLQATTADEVFRILKDEHPDAMVVEWQETKFNCKGLLARIREMEQYDAVIRVVLSALTDSAVQRDIIDAGAHRYMAKMDTNPAKLSMILKQLIEERDG